MVKRESLRTSARLFLSIVVCLTCTLIFSQASFSESVRGVTDTTITVGLISDQTGPIAGDIGLPATETLRIYTRHVNDSGGIFGRKVKLIVEDDRYSIPAGIAAFKKLVFKDRIFELYRFSSLLSMVR